MTVGYACCFCFLACIGLTLLISGYVLQGLDFDNGELAVFANVKLCYDATKGFTVGGVTWDPLLVHLPAVSSPSGYACPISPPQPGQVEVFMNNDWAWAPDKTYMPVVLLPQGAYALLSYSVVDATGNTLVASKESSLGPSNSYPWTMAGATTAPSGYVAPAATDGCTCFSGSCSYESDGVCDDGGAGSEYSLCSKGSDCFDCGPRCGEPALPPSPSLPPPALTGGRRLVASDGGRQLLKGGSWGGTGGRTSTSRSGAWGSSKPTRVTYTGSSSGTTRYYYVGGYYYRGGSSSSYEYGDKAIESGAQLNTVTPYESTVSVSLGRTEPSPTTLSGPLDRYVVDGFTLPAPPKGSVQWPLRLQLDNVTVFVKRGHTGERGLFFSFATSANDDLDEWANAKSDQLLTAGWIMTVVFFYMLFKMGGEGFPVIIGAIALCLSAPCALFVAVAPSRSYSFGGSYHSAKSSTVRRRKKVIMVLLITVVSACFLVQIVGSSVGR